MVSNYCEKFIADRYKSLKSDIKRSLLAFKHRRINSAVAQHLLDSGDAMQ